MARKKKSRNTKLSPRKALILIIVVAGCLLMARSIEWDDSRKPDVTERQTDINGNLLDVKTAKGVPEARKQYLGMDISFNTKAHIPNWVSWELTDKETEGTAPRTNKFANDPEVEGCPDTWDYSYSGYDRGHMAPAGDMKWNPQAMEETFYLTNICPQAKALNTGSWRTLEEKCRVWAKALGHIYIVCGPVIDGKPMEYIGDSKVYVPSAFFKAIIAPDADPAMGIGFIMPNSKVAGGMQRCAVSIDSIESLTGHDLFPALPDKLEAELESQCNFNRWSTIRNRK